MLTVGYFGDGPWAHRALERLLGDPDIRVGFVCARYHRPDDVLKAIAAAHGVPFMTHRNINSDAFLSQEAVRACDLFVSMSFNQIFTRATFDAPKFATINCHAGKLPFYRGRNVLNWALINDEAEFGITVHYVDEGIDTGDIILQHTFPIDDRDTYASLLDVAHRECPTLLFDAVKQIQAGTASRRAQREICEWGSYYPRRVDGDERLDWTRSSREVFNLVRAISLPGPQARTRAGAEEFRINRVEWLPGAPTYTATPGAVIGRDVDGFLVKTGDSYVRVNEWSGESPIRIGMRLS